MADKYLLPCRCGRFVVIKPRQAGETVSCECGVSIQAPTMREITSLDPAPVESDQETATSAWGAKNRFRLLGGLIFAAAAVGMAVLFWNRPVSPFQTIDPERLKQSVQEFTPLQTWTTWQTMKEGLDRRVDQKYMDKMASFRLGEIFFLVMGLLGAALFVAGLQDKKFARRTSQ